MFCGFENQTEYFNYHFNRIKKIEYLSNKYEISKIDKEFLEKELLNGFDSNNPFVNKLYGETIKKWLYRHISKC